MEAQESKFSDLELYAKCKKRVKKDFPKQGVSFLDFNQCFLCAEFVRDLADFFIQEAEITSEDVIFAPEARGFILGPVIAERCGCAFVPLRKPGKLPNFGNIRTEIYGTEYSKDSLDLDLDLLSDRKIRNIIIYDDVLATGGTAAAAVRLAKLCSPKEIKCCFFAEILDLGGCKFEDLADISIHSLMLI